MLAEAYVPGVHLSCPQTRIPGIEMGIENSMTTCMAASS